MAGRMTCKCGKKITHPKIHAKSTKVNTRKLGGGKIKKVTPKKVAVKKVAPKKASKPGSTAGTPCKCHAA